MSGKRIIVYIVGSFIIGTFLLCYLEYNSTKHVNALVTANKTLLDEFQITKNLLDAAKSKVVIERKIRGFIESGDTTYLSGLDTEFHEIQSAQQFLSSISDDSVSVTLIAELNHSIQLKVDLFRNILEAWRRHGTKAAEDTINANLPEWVSYDIERNVRKITDARGYQLGQITGGVRKSGQKALEFSYIVMGLVLLAAAIVVFYIIHIIRKLIRSEKMLRDTARVKENFLANMSHEIRTPMNAIVGFTQLLGQKQLDEDARHYVHTIERSGENLLAIVNDILDISKIEAGMMRIEHVPFSLRGLVNSIETMVLPRAHSKGLRLQVEIDKGTPDILEGDPVRLTQILHNLLGNALKFTAEGTVALKVHVAEQLGNNVKIRLVVSDTGIGIEPQKLKHIFGRFEQADDTITRQYGGTGLGLSIVRDLVQLQGGTIEVESNPGAGTVFQVTIPYTVSTNQIADSHSIPASPLPGTGNAAVEVLITEDNEFNQSLLSHLFKNWNLRFEIANNGLEAIEKLRHKKYDLVLMDIQMPVMDGYTTARKIRNELRLDIPIIAMTAHAMPGEREKCLSYGMNEYIAKPVKQEQLSRLISKFTAFVEPGVQETPPEAEALQLSYQFINLEYLQEVSAGNKAYEKLATHKFLQAVPAALEELKQAHSKGEEQQMKAVAHNLKTTISVMGLNELLNPLLDEIEYYEGDERKLNDALAAIEEISHKAMGEARLFQQTLV
ncbi:ATP-binding protein [Paraflavitalea sp. CAU 1676]|uniref:ATP-binding protein n=1 Tax=Paraflavitalea sp. CAU 1676 TaxID=3032598 RepID=UPI0023DA518B|nr:ATP-binding protein [Paraflavitalea sp. CAU 1676]MDF2193760.1 ATP-binding protein [Paraflavitalea sp. CAU 1676]